MGHDRFIIEFLIELSINKPKLIIHPGFGRTGTSTIQYILRSVIKNKNIVYNPEWLKNIFNKINTYKIKEKDYEFYFDEIRHIFFKLSKSKSLNKNIILSMESIVRWDNRFSESDIKDLSRIVNIASNIYDVRVIISHRLPSDLTSSNYIYLKSRNKKIIINDDILTKEYLINLFNELKNIENNGASKVQFLFMNQIKRLDWLDKFGLDFNLSNKFKKKFSQLKLNKSPNFKEIIILSFLIKYDKEKEDKLIEFLYGSFLFNIYINIRSRLFKVLLFLTKILVKIIAILNIKFLFKNTSFQKSYFKKYKAILFDLEMIKKSHEEIDSFYLNNILRKYK